MSVDTLPLMSDAHATLRGARDADGLVPPCTLREPDLVRGGIQRAAQFFWERSHVW